MTLGYYEFIKGAWLRSNTYPNFLWQAVRNLIYSMRLGESAADYETVS